MFSLYELKESMNPCEAFSIRLHYLSSVSVFSICLQYLSSVSVFSFCLQFLSSVSVFSFCLQFLSSVSVFSICLQYLSSVSVFSICPFAGQIQYFVLPSFFTNHGNTNHHHILWYALPFLEECDVIKTGRGITRNNSQENNKSENKNTLKKRTFSREE